MLTFSPRSHRGRWTARVATLAKLPRPPARHECTPQGDTRVPEETLPDLVGSSSVLLSETSDTQYLPPSTRYVPRTTAD
jgi:hypothetical protein